jgi:phosphoribosylaminoimidazole-succinocarboxamide synthase
MILADTKFEFGTDSTGALVLIDEVLTPDSSRYWPVESYEPGRSPPATTSSSSGTTCSSCPGTRSRRPRGCPPM